MDEREKRLRAIDDLTIIQDLREDWKELRKTEDDLSAVVGILTDEYFNWMKLDSKNELTIHHALIELVSEEQTSPQQLEVLKELKTIENKLRKGDFMKEYWFCIKEIPEDLREDFGFVSVEIYPKDEWAKFLLDKDNHYYQSDDEDQEMIESLEHEGIIEEMEWIFSTEKTEEEVREFFNQHSHFIEIDELFN